MAVLGIGAIVLGSLIAIPQGRYRLERFRCLFDSTYSPQEACYQLNQSLIAVGSGGIFGRGLGESRQKFLYLPEVQNDFIFAIIAEETGLVFSIILLLLFALLFYRGQMIASRAPDSFGRNLATGIMVWLTIQVILNIGGIISLLPMTGVPLPFISYGGSAMIAGLAGLGIVAGISKQSKLS
jgi:cell division protein FtsW